MDFRDELYLLTLTIIQEADAEPFGGKVGVGFVIVGRPGSLSDTVFRNAQFSCWNQGSPTEQNLDTTPDAIFRECYKAACAAYFHLVEDPTKGATNYLNEELTRKLRGGVLPGWARDANDPTKIDVGKVTAKIGKHTFLKLP